MVTHYGDIKRKEFYSQLVNNCQKGLVIKHTQQFQKLSLRVNKIYGKGKNPTWGASIWTYIIRACFHMERKPESKNMISRRVFNNNYKEYNAPSPKLTRLKP